MLNVYKQTYMLSIDKTVTKIFLLEDTKAIDEIYSNQWRYIFLIVKRFDEKVNRILNGPEDVYI